MNLGKNIKALRIEKGLTQEKMSEILNESFPDTVNFNKGKISKWENDRETPYLSSAKVLADFFETTVDDLINSDFAESIYSIYNQLEPPYQQKVYNFAEHQLEEQNKVIHIHKDNGDYITETLRGYLSAGTGELQLEEVLEEVEIPVEIIPEQHYDMLLQINGDSMLPMFQDGERIFVRKIEDTGELRSGQIGVFIIDGESYLKKAYKEDNQLRLVSLNDKYDDLIFNEVNDIEVIGTVVM